MIDSLITREEFEAYRLAVEEAIKKTDANFVAIIELLGEKDVIDADDIARLMTYYRPKILAQIDQQIQEKKEGSDGTA